MLWCCRCSVLHAKLEKKKYWYLAAWQNKFLVQTDSKFMVWCDTFQLCHSLIYFQNRKIGRASEHARMLFSIYYYLQLYNHFLWNLRLKNKTIFLDPFRVVSQHNVTKNKVLKSNKNNRMWWENRRYYLSSATTELLCSTEFYTIHMVNCSIHHTHWMEILVLYTIRYKILLLGMCWTFSYTVSANPQLSVPTYFLDWTNVFTKINRYYWIRLFFLQARI